MPFFFAIFLNRILPMTFKRLTDLDVAGKRVFIRADLNVPQDDNLAITDDTRIRAALPGIQYALEKGAAVMVTLAPRPPDRRRIQARRLLARSPSACPNCSASTSACPELG